MKKILLIFEDYSELSATEVYLKKVGFDAVGVSNESKLADQLLAFNPDVVVAHGVTQRVSSLSIGAKLKENPRFHGKVVIILPKGFRPSPQDLIRIRMDATLEAPVDPIRLLQILAKMSHLDPAAIVEKFKKSTLTAAGPDRLAQESQKVSGKRYDFGEQKVSVKKAQTEAIPFAEPSRAARYAQFLKTKESTEVADLHSTTFNKQEVKDRQEALAKTWSPEELAEQDRLKQQFAQALFKK